MTQADLCIYTAKLQVAGYYYFEQGKPREEMKIVRGSRLRSMHELQAALTGTIVALTLLAAPAPAEKDAATKAREGDVNHWIEYYRKDREQSQPVAPAPQGAVVEEGMGKVKGDSGKVKVEREKPEGQQ